MTGVRMVNKIISHMRETDYDQILVSIGTC